MLNPKFDIPYGTLDLLVLRSLDTMGPMNGYRIARRIEQTSNNLLNLNQGSIYPALLRLQQNGWIDATDGLSETNRKVKIYAITKTGSKRLQTEIKNWEDATVLVARFLEATS